MSSYVTLTLLKQALSITDDGRNELLQQALDAASAQVDRMTGRSFGLAESASTRTFRTAGRVVRGRYGTSALLVDDIADLTGATVATGWGTSFTAYTGWTADPVAAAGWPTTSLRGLWGSDEVQVTAIWGWPSVPADVAQATLIQASRLYKRKDSPEGVMGSADWGGIRVSRVDPDVAALLAPYVIPGFA